MIDPSDAAILESVQAWWRNDQERTGARDHGSAERAVVRAYAEAGWRPPDTILWFDSPLAGWLALPLVQHSLRRSALRRPWGLRYRGLHRPFPGLLDQAEATSEAARLDRLDGWRPRAHLDDDTRISYLKLQGYLEWEPIMVETDVVGARQRLSVLRHEDAAIASAVIDQVQGQLGHVARDGRRREPRGREIMRRWLVPDDLTRPQPTGVQIAYADAMVKLGLTDFHPLRHHVEVARHCGLWWARRDIAILTDRPVQRFTDDHGRVHHDEVPALTWADGWRVYARHGNPSRRPS